MSAQKFEFLVHWLPNIGTCDEDSSILSCTKPKTLSCWLLRSSTKFDVCLYRLESIRICQKKRERKEQSLSHDKKERKECV